MQKLIIALLFCLSFSQASAADSPPVEAPHACQQCRMDRTRFAHSRMLLTYADQTVVGLCSLHCAVVELAQQRGKEVRSLLVADYQTKMLTDVRTATWVIGGDKKGVMTFVPKWAFVRPEDAQVFVQEYGGEVTTFAAALKAAHAEEESDEELVITFSR